MCGLAQTCLIMVVIVFYVYMPYEGRNLSNQKSRKLGVYGRKLVRNHTLFYFYFDKY